jgi:branched-chain amino acid transport system ATP-binding protein
MNGLSLQNDLQTSVLLSVQSVSKSYGAFKALQAFSVELYAGEITALIGPNGAGKSTLFKIIAAELLPDEGRINWPNDKQRVRLGRTYQLAEIFKHLSVMDHLQLALHAAFSNKWNFFKSFSSEIHSQALQMLDEFDLLDLAQQKAGELSYGDVRKLEFALACAARPLVLLMDEPCSGMAEPQKVSLMRSVKAWCEKTNCAVLFTEHSPDLVFEFAQKVLVMNAGRLIKQGSPEEVQNDLQVQSMYLKTKGVESWNL